jgi:hypothetical protein
MTAFNVVRFRVKPDGEAKFLDVHRRMRENLPGMKHAALIKTGERAYCLVGEWERFEDIAAARPKMIGLLDRFRDTLEDLGGGLGVTDPVSGEVVIEMALHA